MADVKYCIEYAKTGRSGCKKCKQQIEKGVARIGKVAPNPFSDDGGDMKVWYHVKCMFETFKRARATTKKIESPADLEGFAELADTEKEEIKQLIKEMVPPKSSAKTAAKTAAKTNPSPAEKKTSVDAPDAGPSTASTKPLKREDKEGPHILFREFQKLCEDLEGEPSYNAKSRLVEEFLEKDGFSGDVYLLLKLLLPTAGKKRVYNLQSKQLVKLLSQVFSSDVDEMVEDLEKGDVAETAITFFQRSTVCPPAKTSSLTLPEVDAFLDDLTMVTKEEDQRGVLSKVIRRCTQGDLKYIVRLIKHDLRINAGPKHILEALDPNAYAAFQASHDLQDVVDRVLSQRQGGGDVRPGPKKELSVRAALMTPVKPMLAEACRSAAAALKKCPNGMYAEIKYDGERVQVHKNGDRFEFFSRSLKAVQAHKVESVKDYLPQACPHGNSMILDSEVLLVDHATGKPLPFGTLGVHKKSAFQGASCCLFIFDIVYFNGESLMTKPLCERRKLLEQNISPVKNHIMLSEQTLVKKPEELSELMLGVIKQGLEGLVLKDLQSIYEPGKRHWLKMKKDYLDGGAMADTADLIVLGAYYGTGNKGGMMSVFLMGLYDKSRDKFCTVAKCGNGHDDATIARLQKELDMVKISKDYSKVPSWLLINKTLTPDFVVRDPKAAPVWEITGAEFTKSSTHTAAGISIRFPRVTKIRDDKDWTNATDLDRLKSLFKTSKEVTDLPGLKSNPAKDGGDDDDDGDDDGGDDDGGDGDMDVDAPGPSSRKRSSDQATEMPAAKRSRPVCKYGVKCYQKSALHREQFDHPSEGDEATSTHTLTSGGITVAKPLLDLFTGIKFYILPDVANMKELRRLIIAYNGDMMEEHNKSQATYVLTDKVAPPTPSPGMDCIQAEWVWDCLRQCQILSTEKYIVH
ncbi:hypothetical protein EMCRGX_G015992 [Ephydatia muelleri]